MPYADADGVKLYYEERGRGTPVVFVHEFSGDYRAWRRQVDALSSRSRCIVFNARGYPPSGVPTDQKLYSQDRAVADILAILDHLKIQKAHLVGLSMGGFAVLNVGLQHPDRALSLAAGAAGYGAAPDQRAHWQEGVEALASRWEREGAAAMAASQSTDPYRVQLQNKDASTWAQFVSQLAEHDTTGAALTLRGVQRDRPSVFELEAPLSRMDIPTLIMVGDEDEPCIAPGLFLKKTIATSGICIFPKTGHTMNLEEPELFNAMLQHFFAQVEARRWLPRDPRSLGAHPAKTP